jgi:hypothetical protein
MKGVTEKGAILRSEFHVRWYRRGNAHKPIIDAALEQNLLAVGGDSIEGESVDLTAVLAVERTHRD